MTLFTNHWDYINNAERQREINSCINRNIDNRFIDRVIIIGQSADRSNIRPSSKVVWEDIDCSKYPYNRPTFRAYFDLANKYCSSPRDFSIISNTDIYFDQTLGLIKNAVLEKTCIALTRHEVYPHNPTALQCAGASQDTWILQGNIHIPTIIDWPMGIWACDNRLCYELANAGYRLINPCYSIKAHHLHRDYDVGDRGDFGGPNSPFGGALLYGQWKKVPYAKLDDCNISYDNTAN